MAFTERYVTDAAGGGGVGTEGDPWTLAEALTNAVAGDRVNILSDSGYSLGADTVTNIGTAAGMIVFRGYNSTIGDLQNPGRSATTGELITTGFPIITLTGALIPNKFVAFQNIAFTGAISGTLIGSSTIDVWGFVECDVVNTQNNSNARAVLCDNDGFLINSDFECTGATHDNIVEVDFTSSMLYCRIKAAGGIGFEFATSSTVVGNVFIGAGSSIAIRLAGGRGNAIITLNTFYNWGTAIELSASTITAIPNIVNNHITDCAKYIDDLRVATDSNAVIEMNNRTRDNTTPRTGVGDGILSGEVTTDTGGAETDYTNAGADDLSLIPGAPGRDVGLGFG